ncbi:MAG: universal stress protein, partial [Lysinibacillus sp.]
MTLYKHIAVAIDFSKQSMEALERALNLKEQYGAQLTLVAVVDTVSFGSVEAYDVKYARQLAKDYEVQLQALKDEHAAKYGEL